MAEPLLDRLKKAGGKPLSGAALAKGLGVSRAAVHKQVVRLRRAGHRIVGVNRLGYSLESIADNVDGAAFRENWGRPFFFFPEVASTQEEAKRRALAGAPEGALFLAEKQTGGRGRLGRKWESPSGGLWYSLVLRPPMPPGAVPALALAAALEWARLLSESHGLPARVKWPNDVWVGEKKLAGILTEMSAETERVHWVVLGVGLNVNNAPPRGLPTPAVSLKEAAGREFRRQDLLAAWLERFRAAYALCVEKGFPAIREDYRRYSLLEGRAVTVENVGGRLSGVVRGVDAEGRLLLSSSGGTVPVSAGDVRVRPFR